MKNTNNQSKGTPIDKYQRKNRILALLSEGKSRQEIQTIIKDEFGVSQSTLNADFLAALQELKNNQETFVAEVKSVIIDRFELLWQKAIDSKDYKTAVKVLSEQAKLFGLNEPSKIDISDGTFTITFN